MSNMALKECFFCGEINQVVLEKHHIVSQVTEKELNKNGQTLEETRTVWLCRNCHKKLHYLYKVADELMQKIKAKEEQQEIAPDPELLAIRAKLQTILQRITELSVNIGMAEKTALLEKLQAEDNMNYLEAERLIKQLVKEGTIYEPREGYFKIT